MSEAVKHDYSKVPGFEYMSRPDWLIGNKLFLISAPAYLMLDEKAVATNGTFHTGDRRRDMQIAKAEEIGWRTILQMYQIWKDKGTIRLRNYDSDIEFIHSTIQAYFLELQDYERFHHGGNNALRVVDNSVYARLMLFAKELDVFAKDVFKMAITRRTGVEVKDVSLDMGMPTPVSAPKQTTKALSDYKPITERIDYSNLTRRKRY